MKDTSSNCANAFAKKLKTKDICALPGTVILSQEMHPTKTRRYVIMLMLGRNPEEYVVIGDSIVIKVVSADGSLKLAIDAPKEMTILRGEVYERTHKPPKCITKSPRN